MWQSFDSTQKPFISYDGKLPERLYRYRTVTPKNLDRIIDFEILEEGIYLAALKELNDPDEGRFLIRFAQDNERIFEHWRSLLTRAHPRLSQEHIATLAHERLQSIVASEFSAPIHVVNYVRHCLEHVVRTACFTTQSVNYSMWANYARYLDLKSVALDHAGVCIEYQCDNGWRQLTLHPVTYSDEIPVVDPMDRDEEKLVKVLYSKSREWRAEEEWRIAYLLNALPPFKEGYAANAKIQLTGAVQSVIFGIHTLPCIVEQVRERVYAARPEIQFKKVVVNPLTYTRELTTLPPNP